MLFIDITDSNILHPFFTCSVFIPGVPNSVRGVPQPVLHIPMSVPNVPDHVPGVPRKFPNVFSMFPGDFPPNEGGDSAVSLNIGYGALSVSLSFAFSHGHRRVVAPLPPLPQALSLMPSSPFAPPLCSFLGAFLLRFAIIWRPCSF